MKIPESIRVGGVEFSVVRVYRLNDGLKMLAGQIRPMECQIAIAEESSHEYACLSLWHEIMHAIEEQAQLELGEDRERIIEAFARGVYQVLQDNGERLFDLARMIPVMNEKKLLEGLRNAPIMQIRDTAEGEGGVRKDE